MLHGTRRLGSIASAFVAAALLVTSLSSAPASLPSRTAAHPAPRPSADTAVVRGEVRLRKLHLVRPDLIPYPIAFEVVC